MGGPGGQLPPSTPLAPPLLQLKKKYGKINLSQQKLNLEKKIYMQENRCLINNNNNNNYYYLIFKYKNAPN